MMVLEEAFRAVAGLATFSSDIEDSIMGKRIEMTRANYYEVI
ncbi:hypothetical protein [Bifidobacterium asteroides]